MPPVAFKQIQAQEDIYHWNPFIAARPPCKSVPLNPLHARPARGLWHDARRHVLDRKVAGWNLWKSHMVLATLGTTESCSGPSPKMTAKEFQFQSQTAALSWRSCYWTACPVFFLDRLSLNGIGETVLQRSHHGNPVKLNVSLETPQSFRTRDRWERRRPSPPKESGRSWNEVPRNLKSFHQNKRAKPEGKCIA